jgi:EAL domain-containing protein (putative c-di-GMP-specific phosphodiesterase class I)
MQPPKPDLGRILGAGLITTHFQPLVSIKQRSVFALEALSRGTATERGPLIPPAVLFQLAANADERLALDRLCRTKALAAFAPHHRRQPQLLLSLNLDASCLSRDSVGSGHLHQAVRRSGVSPGNVILEIIESQATDIESLGRFVEAYRQLGFLIALDDVGSGHSNLDRITILKPDIIKIDRSLIQNIHEVYHKQEITKSLVNLCTKIGALPVAEGVESAPEILCLLRLGLDLFQGYHFARPALEPEPGEVLGRRIQDMAAAFKLHMVRTLNARKRRHAIYNNVTSAVIDRLAQVGTDGYNPVLAEALGFHPDLECLYVLDLSGIQVSATVCDPDKLAGTRRLYYQPAESGTDHSLKEYFLPLTAGLTRFTTECYISLASGNLCQTISALFTDGEGAPRILCLDIHQDANCAAYSGPPPGDETGEAEDYAPGARSQP